MKPCPTRAASGERCELEAGHPSFHRAGTLYWGRSHLPSCARPECLVEAVDLLGLWYGRWQGFVAGTPEEMHLRTARFLIRHGHPPREMEVQR